MRFAQGDIVRVKPHKGRRDGFTAKVLEVKGTEVTLYGGPGGRKAFRVVTADRLVKKRKQP